MQCVPVYSLLSTQICVEYGQTQIIEVIFKRAFGFVYIQSTPSTWLASLNTPENNYTNDWIGLLFAYS